MTHFQPPYSHAPVSDIDPYELGHLEDSRAFHKELRGNGPLVWLTRYGVWATGKHQELTAIFKDHTTFCSSRGVGLQDFHKETPWRPPSLILEADPPAHTRTRKVLSDVLSPKSLAALRETFESEARRLVAQLLANHEVDGVEDVAVAFPMKVFPDAVGLSDDNRHRLLDYGNMVFNALGPRNAIVDKAMANADVIGPWIAEQCARENLAEGGFGHDIYQHVDRGAINPEEASLLVRSILSAGLDTTVIALGNALHCFAEHPQQWQHLRDDPSRARFAFEEVLRYESPVHTFYRTASRDTELSGTQISEGHKVLLNIECANRDTDRWPDADVFDILRKPGGQATFGVGIHACVGRHLAMLEAEVLLQALAAKVDRIELAGDPVREPNNALRGYKTLPLVLH